MFKPALIAVLTLAAAPAFAEGLAPVRDKSEFVSLISGRELTRLGITLNVSPSGGIAGSAFGTEVTGKWRWSKGYFCRDLFYGKKDLGPNCQLVESDGRKIRFTSDQGKGQSADLRLK